ncbi:DUF7674 family protein [Pseudoblastomonas halimionae]|uniref:DUF7674 domain-containing protein n=1 Tax=Alteriqipengyuania halimionae TaxID=1926630 RepID=A0A6I4U1U6_9SPHN|nr:hypothetical protein [Alteriqipengyuania halimionae]MXP09706.1 hypothetical protein [Alteriqipengyuania halimionae]
MDERFEALTDQFIAEYRQPSEPSASGLPYYILMGSIADEIVTRMKNKDEDSCRAAFELVEKLHVEGDEYVQEAATVGLLEAVQGYMKGVMRFECAHRYLGPESRKWWDKLIRFWDHGDAAALRHD